MFNPYDLKNIKLTLQSKINYLDRSKKQRETEQDLADSFSNCPVERKLNLADLNAVMVKNKIRDNFYNSNVTTAIACINNNLITISPQWESLIKSYITDLKALSEQGTTSQVFFANLKNPHNKSLASNIFIVKTANEDTENDILHESIVGMVFLNNLRQIIPNFSCIYGFFKCGSSSVDKAGNSSLCGNGEPTGHVIYENIDNSKSMNDLILGRKITLEQWFQYFIQLLLALKTANQYYNFTHYDLHGGNVLARKLSHPAFIKFPNDVYLKTDAVITIIDYGMSYVSHKNTELGSNYNFEKYNVFNNQSFIIHDVFKFLGSSLVLFAGKAANVFDDLLSYFYITDHTGDIYDLFLFNREYYYCPVYNQATKNFDIDNFIFYVLGIMQKHGYTSPLQNPTTNDKILSCDGQVCESLDSLLKDFKI